MLSHKRNKKISFLIPYPPGIAPGQRFRFEQYFEQLTNNGSVIKLFPFLSWKANDVLYESGHYTRKITGVLAGFIKRFIYLPQILSADLIFIFREATPLGPPFVEWFLSNLFHKKIIYDFDDAIWLPNTSKENKIVSWLKWHGKVKSICRWSHTISCGNSYLADYARSFNPSVVINPTTIDTEGLHNPQRYAVEKGSREITIGWTGTHSTLPYLLPLLPVIESLWKKYPQILLLVLADRAPDWNRPFLRFVKWNKETEIADLMKIDLGIMPMPEDTWTNGKCGFKALQYMSLQKPALVSPVGVNAEIVDHGVNGFHCNSPEEWFNNLEYLIQHRHLCNEMGIKGRQKVIEFYSERSNTSNFLSLFE